MKFKECLNEGMKIISSDEFISKYVKNGKILPNNVDKIGGNLGLGYNKISKIENLPKEIGGSLYLSHNPIYKHVKNFDDAKRYLKKMKLKEILK